MLGLLGPESRVSGRRGQKRRKKRLLLPLELPQELPLGLPLELQLGLPQEPLVVLLELLVVTLLNRLKRLNNQPPSSLYLSQLHRLKLTPNRRLNYK